MANAVAHTSEKDYLTRRLLVGSCAYWVKLAAEIVLICRAEKPWHWRTDSTAIGANPIPWFVRAPSSTYYKYFLKLLAVTAMLKANRVANGRMTKVGCTLNGSAR